MADQYVAVAEAIQCGAATALVVLNLTTASTRRINLNELGVTFNGTSATATPVQVRLVRTSGTPSGTPLTSGPNAIDPAAPVATASGLQPSTATPGVWTTAPTVGATLRSWYVPPTSGLILQHPLGQEVDVAVSAGLGIQIVAPAAVQVNSYLVWTE